MADDKILVEIVLDDGSIQKGFINLEKKAKESSNNMEKTFDSFTKKIIGIGATIAAALFSKASIDAAIEQEDSINRLNIALSNTGKFSKETSLALQSFAGELQATTRFSDDAILNTQALIQNLASLDEQGLKRATQAAVDLSSALRIDLDSAARLVGKSATGNVDAFKRYGLEIEKASSDTQTFANALTIINQRFGGSAASSVNTYSGSIAQLKNIFGDLLEEIGNIVVKSPAVVASIKFISQEISKFTDLFKSFTGDSDIFKTLIINFSILSQAGIKTFHDIVDSSALLLRSLQVIGQYIVTVSTLFSERAVDNLLYFKGKLAEVLAEIENPNTDGIKFFDDLILKVQEAGNVTDEFSAKMSNALAGPQSITVFQAFSLAIQGARDELKSLVETADEGFKKMGASAIKGIGQGVGQAFGAFGKALANGENALKAFLKTLIAAIGQQAIAVGTEMILRGIGYSLDPFMAAFGPPLIGAGAALATFGGVLGAVGQGGGASGGAASSSASVSSLDSPSATDPEPVQQKRKTEIILNVHGNIFNTKETARNIAELVNEAFDSDDIKLVRA